MPLTPTNDIVYGDVLSQIQPNLVSGTNIKTINGTSLLGSGDLVVNTAAAVWGNITGTLSNQTDLNSVLGLKADLVAGVIPISQLPSYVDAILEFANSAVFPATGSPSKIYLALDTNFTYRWSGTIYTRLNSSLILGELATTAYRGDRGAIAYNHSQLVTGNPHNTAIGDITGLTTSLATKAVASSLATVATSGSYNDLINKPSIPDGQINSDWNATTGVRQILNKPIVPNNLSQLNNDIGFVTNGYVTNAISAKQDVLVSNTNIKTINGTSILGSGNVVISASGGTWGTITGTLSNQTDLQSALNVKQNIITTGNLIETTSSVLTITNGANSVLGSGVNVQVKQATTSQSGYLSSTDWATFNAKQSVLTLGNLTEASSSILNIVGGTNAIIGSGLSVQVKQANASQAGYLSSSDWTTFNNKFSSASLPNETYNWVVSGLNPTVPSASLTMSIPSGQSVIQGKVVNYTSTPYTYSANKYTFDDLKLDGTITHTAITPGGQIPQVASDSVRLAQVTSTSVITSIVDLRRLEPVNREIAEPGFTPLYLLNNLYISSGAYTGAWRYSPSGKLNWYFCNVALHEFFPVLTQTQIKNYLNLYISKIEANFSIQDIDTNLVTKVTPDSNDSYASTFLRLASKYYKYYNDIVWWKANVATLKNIAYNNLALQTKVSGLIKVFQSGSPSAVGYLMDNCENYSGLKEFTDVLLITEGVTSDYTYYITLRNGVATGVYSLYDATNNYFLASDNSTVDTNWYPGLTCQIYPELHGVPKSGYEFELDNGWQYLNTNAPAWWETKYDAFPWMVVAYYAGTKRKDLYKAFQALNWSKKYFLPQLGLYTIDNLGWAFSLMNYFDVGATDSIQSRLGLTYEYKESFTISNNTKSDQSVPPNVDVMPTVQALFNSLDTTRTGRVLIKLKGSFTIASTAIIPNEGNICLDLTEAIFTISNTWNPTNGDLNGSSWIAGFQVGTKGGLIQNVEIFGGVVTGTCFQSSTGSTTDLANIYTGTSTGTTLIWNTSSGTVPNGSNGNKPKIAFIFGEAVMINCFFHDMRVRNMGTPITFEGMAKINGTPSDNVLIYNIREEKIWVGVQFYGNGYSYQNCHIYNISVNRCYDDCIAICANSGGINGTTYGFATLKNCTVKNITGFKGGLTGSGAKLDPGSQYSGGSNAGAGIAVNTTYDNINLETDGSGEHLVAYFKGQNQASKNNVFDHLNGQGTWSTLGFYQVFGRALQILTVDGESTNGVILQGSTTANTRQNIKLGNWNIAPTQSTTGDNRRGNGLTICAGGAGQGFMNITCTGKITTYNIAVPINETTPPTGFGVGSTNTNVSYNIDITYQNVSPVTITDCLFSSTNRIVELWYFGQYQGRYGDLNILSGNINVLAGNILASGTITGSNLSGTNTGNETTASIKSKLGITTLTGANTGDQDLSGYATAASVATGLSTKEPTITPTTSNDYYRGDKSFQPLTKFTINLGNVDNTSDLSKPISNAVQTALAFKADLVGGFVPQSQLPSYVDDILEFATYSVFPTTGETGKIYVDLATNRQWRWSGSAYINITNGLIGSTSDVPEGSNLYFNENRVRLTPLTGITSLTGTPATSSLLETDSLLIASAKHQNYLDYLAANKQNSLSYTPEDSSLKSSNILLGNSDSFYPTQKAVRSFVLTEKNKITVGGAGTNSDYTVTGVNDHIPIQNAFDALISGGLNKIEFKPFIYDCQAQINVPTAAALDVFAFGAVFNCASSIGFSMDGLADGAWHFGAFKGLNQVVNNKLIQFRGTKKWVWDNVRVEGKAFGFFPTTSRTYPETNNFTYLNCSGKGYGNNDIFGGGIDGYLFSNLSTLEGVALTGNGSITTGTNAITGTGTNFLSTFKANDIVYLDYYGSNTNLGKVATVNSDTSITLVTTYAGATITNKLVGVGIYQKMNSVRVIGGSAEHYMDIYSNNSYDYAFDMVGVNDAVVQGFTTKGRMIFGNETGVNTNVKFIGCNAQKAVRLNNQGTTEISVHSGASAPSNPIGVVISGCTVTNGFIGTINASPFNFLGCTITDNIIDGSGITANNGGVSLQGTTGGVVGGNTIKNCAYGIKMNISVGDVTIAPNTFFDISTSAIYDESLQGRNTILPQSFGNNVANKIGGVSGNLFGLKNKITDPSILPVYSDNASAVTAIGTGKYYTNSAGATMVSANSVAPPNSVTSTQSIINSLIFG